MTASTHLEQVIANRLRELMTAHRDLGTQVKLASRSGVAQSTVSRILSADTSTTIDSIADLAHAFGVPPASLLLSDPVEVELLVAAQGLTAEGRERLLGYAAALSAGAPVKTAAPCLSNDQPLIEPDRAQKMSP